jgi:hypothetical protein
MGLSLHFKGSKAPPHVGFMQTAPWVQNMLLLLHIQYVPSSNCGPNTGYADRRFRAVHWYFQASAAVVLQLLENRFLPHLLSSLFVSNPNIRWRNSC